MNASDLFMKKFCFCLSILILSISAQSQSSKPAPYPSFIPKGFTLLDSAYGDLNKDAYKDMVLILRNDAEQNNADTTRPLLLLAGTANGLYNLMERNDHVVLCAGCGGVMGDPYQGITIKGGYFSIEHYGGSSWRWTRIITFKYDSTTKKFKLHRDAGVSFHASEPDKQKETVHNKKDFGKLFFSQFNQNDIWKDQ